MVGYGEKQNHLETQTAYTMLLVAISIYLKIKTKSLRDTNCIYNVIGCDNYFELIT